MLVTSMISLNPLSTKEINWAWLAGLIDGDGYVGITRQRKKENTRQSASLIYHPYLIISNSNLKVLEFIKKLIGYGYIHKNKKRNKPNQKPGFQYKLAKMDNLDIVLRAVQPHLRIKQKQCKLLLNFIKLRKNAKKITGKGHRGATSYTVEEEIYQKLLFLNKRGM